MIASCNFNDCHSNFCQYVMVLEGNVISKRITYFKNQYLLKKEIFYIEITLCLTAEFVAFNVWVLLKGIYKISMESKRFMTTSMISVAVESKLKQPRVRFLLNLIRLLFSQG